MLDRTTTSEEYKEMERQKHWKCWAYKEDGSICGEKAVGLNKERTYTVCERHLEAVK